MSCGAPRIWVHEHTRDPLAAVIWSALCVACIWDRPSPYDVAERD